MGISSSKYDLRKEKIVGKLPVGGLADVLGYLKGEEAEELIVRHTANNWGFRGKNAVKENIVNLCTAAVQGQGKTELCRHLILNSENIRRQLCDVEILVPIHITFSQYTTFSQEESNGSVDKALIWRILHAFGNGENCSEYQHSLRSLLREIRCANKTRTSSIKSVGIFLMVDEVLKVRDADLGFFKRMLDELTGLQHRELKDGFPTFVLMTSLELLPVSEQIIIGSGRPLQIVPMPFLGDLDLESISSTLFLQFKTVLCAGRPDHYEAQLDRFNNLKLLIRVAISVSGRHFRCLEEAVKALYKRLVSEEQHVSALQCTDALFPKLYFPTKRMQSHQHEDIFTKKGGDVDISIKEVFDSVVNQVELTSVTKDHYRQAMDLFLMFINDPDMVVSEQERYDLEARKILFVKWRDLERSSFIVPRINLPFLFLYPRAERLSNCETYDYGSRSSQSQGRTRQSPAYWRLTEPRHIKLHIEVLLGNIGVALSQPFSSLASTFEEATIFAEMLTVAARLSLPPTSIRVHALEDLIPDVIFKPWGNESLSVSRFVLEDTIRITSHASPDLSDGAGQTPESAVKDALRCAFDVNSDVVYYTQGRVKMERIEHVSRLFSVRGKQVVSMCSMKLREKTNHIAVARDLHKFVHEKIMRSADCPVPDEGYYAMIYCCAPKATIAVDELPRGTIIVPFESVRRLLYPFGLNPLLAVAEEKYQASKR